MDPRDDPAFAYRKADLPLPDAPTNHLPGSQAKIELMIERLRSGRHLHHPKDIQRDDDNRCLIPTISHGNNKIVGWREVTEQEYRKERHYEPWWGCKNDTDG